jgi:hypothetical protein
LRTGDEPVASLTYEQNETNLSYAAIESLWLDPTQDATMSVAR